MVLEEEIHMEGLMDYIIVSILGKKILPLGAWVVVVVIAVEDPVDRGLQEPWCHLQSPLHRMPP